MSRRQLQLPIICIAVSMLPGLRAQSQIAGPIVTIAEVHKSGLPGQFKRIKGIVTLVNDHHFYLQDKTGAIHVQFKAARGKVGAGDEVETSGSLVRFPHGLQLQTSVFEKTGTRPLPKPEDLPLRSLLHGVARDQLVRTRASVHDVALVGGEVRLLLQAELMPGESASAAATILRWRLAPTEPQVRPDHLLDALVEITGVAAKGSSPDGKLLGLSQLELNSPDDVKIIEPGDADVFKRPQRTLASLRAKLEPYNRRIKTHGTVTYASEGGWFYLQDETGVGRAGNPEFMNLPADQRRAVQPNPPLYPGDQIEIVGFPYHREHRREFMPWLVQCEWRVTSRTSPPPFVPLQASSILMGNYDGRSVTLIGRVLDISVQRDVRGFFNHIVTLDDDSVPFTALVQKIQKQELPLQVGSYVRIDGIVKADQDEAGATKSFRLNVNEIADLRHTTKPWRPAQLLPWLLGAMAAGLVVAVWIIFLRRQVRFQTAKLRDANEELGRFKCVADTSSDLIAMATLDQRPLYFNPAGLELLGLPPDTDAGTVQFSDIYTEESLARFEQEGFAHALLHGHWTDEVTMRHLDGHVIPVSFVGLIIKSAAGKPQYMSCIARDISGRLAQENQLRASLEHERELNQLKSSFVNTISHEFRTPLGIILFASSMLRRFDERFGPEGRAQQLDAIDKAVDQMNDLVEQSLSLGRAEVAAPKKTEFNLHEFSRRLIDEIKSATSYCSPIILEAPENLPLAIADETMLRTILSNLLGNAVKYSPAGSQVTLSIAQTSRSVTFTVRDHGPGLREENLPKLFTAFHRGRNAAGIPGTGLGLAIVKRCVESLGGQVIGRDAADDGAEFVVEVPQFFSPS